MLWNRSTIKMRFGFWKDDQGTPRFEFILFGVDQYETRITPYYNPQQKEFKVIPEGLTDAAGADDQYAARVDAFAIAAIDERSPQCAAGAEHGAGEQHGQNDDDAGDDLSAREVDGTAQDQTADQGGLQGHALFIEPAAVLNGSVQAIRAGKEDEADSEPDQVEAEGAPELFANADGIQSAAALSDIAAEPQGDKAGNQSGDDVEARPSSSGNGRLAEDGEVIIVLNSRQDGGGRSRRS